MLTKLELLQATKEDLARLFDKEGHGLSKAQMVQTREPLRNLYTAPKAFQPRDFEQHRWMKESHIKTLSRAIRNTGDPLDHILLFPIAGQRFVIDGHCRLEAYKLAKWNDKVPVRFFKGSFREALEQAIGLNSKDKLPLTPREKWEDAWELVVFDEATEEWSVRRIAAMTGASKSLVKDMRDVLKEHPKATTEEELEDDPRSMTWHEWKQKKRGEREIDEEWEDALVREWSKRLRQTFGSAPDQNYRAFWAALEDAMPFMVSNLKDYLGVPESEDEFTEWERFTEGRHEACDF